MNSADMKFGTKVIHAGIEADPATGAIMTPIYQTSTFKQTQPGDHKGFEYSRSANPTRRTLENNIAALENGNYGLCFGSGMAAIDAVLKLCKSGDEVVSTNDLYGGSYRLFKGIYEQFDIRFRFVSMNEPSKIEAAISERTRLIWVETPTNPMMNIINIKMISKIAKRTNCLLVVDNTFCTPYLQQPLELGADIVMHSVTKYISGHSDVVMGALVTRNEEIAKKLYFIQKSSGAISGPQDCFLVLRGIKTLHLRMERHCENGIAIAQFLAEHPKVDQVFWPGFKDHPNHEIAKNQMKDYGGMISFTIRSNSIEDVYGLFSRFQIFTLAESLGGVESLVCHPVSMTHAAMPKEERENMGIYDNLIRLSVGIEDLYDLKNDLKQALDKL